jgi:DNA-binding response OmpR family regulator
MLKILIIEDEALVGLEMAQSLSDQYEITDTLTRIKEVRPSIEANRPDIIVMDINLNDEIDGITLAQELKEEYDLRVIYVTAFKDEKTIIRAVQTDPFGYLNKPYKLSELQASLELARFKLSPQSVETQESRIELGLGYYYDSDQEALYFNSLHINLGKNEKKLLQLLISARGTTVSFKEIESVVWGDSVTSESTRRTLIYRLRSKLEYRLVETIPNVGVRLKSDYSDRA